MSHLPGRKFPSESCSLKVRPNRPELRKRTSERYAVTHCHISNAQIQHEKKQGPWYVVVLYFLQSFLPSFSMSRSHQIAPDLFSTNAGTGRSGTRTHLQDDGSIVGPKSTHVKKNVFLSSPKGTCDIGEDCTIESIATSWKGQIENCRTKQHWSCVEAENKEKQGKTHNSRDPMLPVLWKLKRTPG